jgi:alkanesulfonate monooxygenase SsuD/methylene tetrahydromethanopterin reductase-like flavin-dependent oxidoreductase (luciferase family)
MVLSENWTLVEPTRLRAVVELARVAEDCGVDTVMLSEHVVLGPDSAATGAMVNPRDYAAPGNQPPATPWPDSVVLAAAIGAVTTRLRVALAALIAPLRHPLGLAKQLATLDLLLEGRLVVQPTVSWSRMEYAALGVDFARRGEILDEQLAVLASVWASAPGSPARHHGAHVSFDDVWIEPRRAERPAMWFGGERLHPAIVDRIVRHGVGFHPFGAPTPEELAHLDAAMVAAGRDPGELELVGGIRGTFDDADSVADLDVALATLPVKVEAGYRSICFKPSMFTDDVAGVADVCRRVVRALEAC